VGPPGFEPGTDGL